MRTYSWFLLLMALAPLRAEGIDVDRNNSALRPLVARYGSDRRAMERRYSLDASPQQRERWRKFLTGWQKELEAVDFSKLDRDGAVDYLLLQNQLKHELRQLELKAKAEAEIARFVPFQATIVNLEEARGRMEPLDSAKAAATLDGLRKQVEALRKSLEAEAKSGAVDKVAANRASLQVGHLRQVLKKWATFYDGYDPLFVWWVSEPRKSADAALEGYAKFLRERLAGIAADDKVTIVGSPIGREALQSELEAEMIPYTPEELLAIGEKEYAWCEAEMKKASRELGFGDDWHKALEHVKGLHVGPGAQPQLIRELAMEAEAFIDKHNLVTVPELAREVWRMEMMTPERQLVNPFFTGGEVISVSFPTSGMTHEQKTMSMRGNNIHFSRATVFHELIPGHHLQMFMADRYSPWRRVFTTPFGIEGWALYWEMLLWDMQFQPSAADRVGALFWRMHRAARIIFSLSFHLGRMTASECVDFLVEKVGHERDNAAGEVRRSFETDYPPLYQAAYMLGGLQIRALRKELVDGGKMSQREFHDRILRLNSIPIEMVRLSLTAEPLRRDYQAHWRFYALP